MFLIPGGYICIVLDDYLPGENKMDFNIFESKLVAKGAVILCVILIIFTGILYFHVITVKEQVRTGQRENATLLAQKHRLQADLERYTADMSALEDKNRKLEQLLKESAGKHTLSRSGLISSTRDSAENKLIRNSFSRVKN